MFDKLSQQNVRIIQGFISPGESTLGPGESTFSSGESTQKSGETSSGERVIGRNDRNSLTGCLLSQPLWPKSRYSRSENTFPLHFSPFLSQPSLDQNNVWASSQCTLHCKHSKATMGAYGRVRFALLCTVYILKIASYDKSVLASSGKLNLGFLLARSRWNVIYFPFVSCHINLVFMSALSEVSPNNLYLTSREKQTTSSLMLG